ncbi:MAG: tetratricopeptide repeat protein [Bacteroidales bacterium]|nr:tetratricopeptide repeat protein [Bacteroidales bacterium]
MKRFFFIAVLLTFFVSIISAQSAKQYFKAGQEFAKKMNYKDAIAQFDRVVEMDPDFEKAYIQRATAYGNLNEFAKSAEDFDRALVFNDKEPDLYYLSGEAHFKTGNYEFARIKLNKAISLKRNFLEAYQIRAIVFMEMGKYEEALEDCQKCLRLKEDEMGYYNLAQVYERLDMYSEAEEAYNKAIAKNRRMPKTHYALANLLYKRKKYSAAYNSITQFLQLNPRELNGILLHSNILMAQGNYPKAYETLSMASVEYPDEAIIFISRGDINVKMNQANYSINDFTKAIELDPEQAEYYYKRAGAYEAIREFEKALNDYEKLLTMSKYDGTAQRLHEEATIRMFELNREENKPSVVLLDPKSHHGNTVDVPREMIMINITGLVEDQSDIKSLEVNGFTVPVEKTDEGFQFMASVNIRETDQITVQVSDIYDNAETAIFPIRLTEVDAPTVQMIAPYGSENNILYLDTNESLIHVEGKVEDESLIKSIYVESALASYIPSDLNPSFTALVNVENKSRITVVVEDEYGNVSEIQYALNRDAQTFEDNPMGKTWAIFIENSDYESFASLEGPTKDITMMKAALARYQIHGTIHKKNMTHNELRKFFAIELRDMIRSNRVNSVLIWYAGHGKFVNETGYWIPVDASRDDEFTYFNINSLKASMQSYPDLLTHTLVITDACESGPSFYQAMRAGIQERNCDDWEATRFKSSQVFSSAGYELAVDDSQFTRTFANVLVSNPSNCVPIENIVQKVTSAVVNSNQQKPQFGKIAGLEDENGSFFFIPKDY